MHIAMHGTDKNIHELWKIFLMYSCIYKKKFMLQTRSTGKRNPVDTYIRRCRSSWWCIMLLRALLPHEWCRSKFGCMQYFWLLLIKSCNITAFVLMVINVYIFNVGNWLIRFFCRCRYYAAIYCYCWMCSLCPWSNRSILITDQIQNYVYRTDLLCLACHIVTNVL